jgi:hypothetical protein
MIRLNIIIPSTPASHNWSLFSEILYKSHLSLICSTCPSYLILLDLNHAKKFGWNLQTIKFFIKYFLPHRVTSSLQYPNIIPNALLSNTLTLRYSLNIRDQLSHPYKKLGWIIVQYTQFFTFLDSKQENKRVTHRTIASVPWIQPAF